MHYRETRRVAIIGGVRIPFCRAHTDYAARSNQDMMTAALNGLVERFNLGQQPMEFVRNAAVKALLESDGAEALPFIFWDGELHSKGRYPTREERPAWYAAAKDEAEVSS